MKRRTFLKGIAGAVPAFASPPHMSAGAVAQVPHKEPPSAAVEKKDFLALAQELAMEKRTVVGVLQHPKYSGREVPRSLRPEHFSKTWGARADVRIVPLDADQIRSYSILFKGRMDILVYPYGALYPMDAFPYFSGDAITHFLSQGGAVLTTGGVPFGMPVDEDGNSPGFTDAAGNTMPAKPHPGLLDDTTYGDWVAPLGYKYYEHPYTPTVNHADRRFFPSLPASPELAGCRIGIIANTSRHSPVPKPSHGNVFPERYPARQVLPLLWGTDKYGQALAVNALLIQDFEDGSRRIHFAHEAEPHPLSPASPYFSALMDDIFHLLTNRCMVKDVETNYACYRQGEIVHVRAELASFEPKVLEAEVILEILAGGQVVYSQSEITRFSAKQSVTKEWPWSPRHFDTDEYEVVVSVRRGDRIVSSAANGFLVWNNKAVSNGPSVDIRGKYFRIGESESFVSGTNYYESTRGEIMWYHPNVKRITQDLRQMREHGVNYIRPHYHHLKWFKDYLLFQHGKLPEFYKNLEEVSNPLPDERTWRIWDAFIYLCQKLGIVYGGDLFTLVPDEMGDPRGWFPLRESVYCPEKRVPQREFLQQLNLRYKDAPGISWDLWNEAEVSAEALKDWTSDMRQTIIKTGVPRLITVGGASGSDLGDTIDYAAAHAGIPDIRGELNRSDRPLLQQEVYVQHLLFDLASESQAAEDILEGFIATLRSGSAGIAPWGWTQQMRLWDDSYEHYPSFPMEKWDDRLGTHVHDDGTIKPSGQAFRDLATLLRTVRLVDFDSSARRIFTDRGELVVKLKEPSGQHGYSLHHVSGACCFAAISLGSASWAGKPLVSGPAGGYVYMFTESGEDLFTARQTFAKTHKPGKLIFHFRSAQPRAVNLVDTSPLGNKRLETLPWSSRRDGIEVTVAPTQQAYWVAVEW